MIKDVMLALTDSEGDPNAMAVSIAIAERMEARLCALVMVSVPMPMPGSWALVRDVSISALHDEMRASAHSTAAGIKRELEKTGLASEVRVVESMLNAPPGDAVLLARQADLTVMTSVDSDQDRVALISRYFSRLLLESGRPLLLVPPRFSALFPLGRAMVAWRPTPESSRALHDALPLLRLAESVDVVEVSPDGGEKGDGELPGADIAAHLARHGLRVRVVVLAQQGTVAETLLAHAETVDAGLLVAGGYGHSRVKEWALGGVTRHLLQSSHVPVLFSH